MNEQPVIMDYTNHRGERRDRKVIPGNFHFGVTDYHPEPAQYHLRAFDCEKGAVRDFAVSGIHGFRTPEGP